ncbi:MAG: NADH-quinone oxidoreductase subunit C [Candidatus Melainabacteria bacterium]|nr:MAG: NADH-quinone oxidoreductase subunit C [Candidatus Melainabacteria bacterium]
MTPEIIRANIHQARSLIKAFLSKEHCRIGLMSSFTGQEIFFLLLDPTHSKSQILIVEIDGVNYTSFSDQFPQLHWYERSIKDFFDLTPLGHPRLRSNFVPSAFDIELAPLQMQLEFAPERKDRSRDFRFMKVAGEGIYEVPVGPVHAGIIEPGHFRLSCLGEYIQNLELRFGYLHRGVEKTITKMPWQKVRYVVEAASSDTACANAIAHARAIESLFDFDISESENLLRIAALETERVAMHIFDLGGMAVDLGCAGVASILSRLRGDALEIAERLSGSRFLRAFIVPGGSKFRGDNILDFKHIRSLIQPLALEIEFIVEWFLDNAQVAERLTGVGKISHNLAGDFGLVGVGARASGIAYDARAAYESAAYFRSNFKMALEENGDGDCLARTKIRFKELLNSLIILEDVLARLQEHDLTEFQANHVISALPVKLPENKVAFGITEAFRGELIHVVKTDAHGAIERYAIKDPSFNNWTAMAICARGNLLADFPICNKSFALSYSGHDL